jgi:hypothetical protein
MYPADVRRVRHAAGANPPCPNAWHATSSGLQTRYLRSTKLHIQRENMPCTHRFVHGGCGPRSGPLQAKSSSHLCGEQFRTLAPVLCPSATSGGKTSQTVSRRARHYELIRCSQQTRSTPTNPLCNVARQPLLWMGATKHSHLAALGRFLITIKPLSRKTTHFAFSRSSPKPGLRTQSHCGFLRPYLSAITQIFESTLTDLRVWTPVGLQSEAVV